MEKVNPCLCHRIYMTLLKLKRYKSLKLLGGSAELDFCGSIIERCKLLCHDKKVHVVNNIFTSTMRGERKNRNEMLVDIHFSNIAMPFCRFQMVRTKKFRCGSQKLSTRCQARMKTAKLHKLKIHIFSWDSSIKLWFIRSRGRSINSHFYDRLGGNKLWQKINPANAYLLLFPQQHRSHPGLIMFMLDFPLFYSHFNFSRIALSCRR